MVSAAGRENGYERRKQRTRQRLIDAAREVFAAKGFESATTEEIAAAAGTSRAAFYLHFDSKAAVLIGALEALWGERDAFSDLYRANVESGSDVTTLRADLLDAVGVDSFPAGALHSATLTDATVAEWYFHRQESAFDFLTAAADIPADRARSLRARFHILGRMTLDAMSDGPSAAATVSRNEAASYVADLWLELLGEIAALTRSSADPRE